MTDPIAWYDANAELASDRYESVTFERIHGWLADLLPKPPAAILDVGAGSGRDAAHLSALGYDVVAVEPSARMRELARARHDDPRINWRDDRLPALKDTFSTGLSFDVILVSAVWMHLAPTDRPRAFRKLITLLKPGGLLAITLREGPDDDIRGFHPVTVDELRRLATDHGAYVARESTEADQMGRGDVRWRQIAIRLPDDGTDALPLLRNVILNDSKSSTYKLGLLRVLCRIADGAFGLAEEQGEDHVAVPMGLVALTWIRLYKPLIQANIPQSPVNDHGGNKLGFVKHAGIERLDVSPHDLRVGARFSGDDLAALHRSLLDVTSTIVRMPIRYMTYPNSDDPILPVRHSGTTRRPTRSADGRLTAGYLESFGTLRVPIHLWMAIRRLSVWIEPAIVAEWKLLMRTYADRQDRQLDEQTLADAMKWLEPERDVRLAREEADRLMAAGPLHCVWTGRRLSRRNLDIDHCFPWAIWPCGDLWNLMPAHRQVNQHEKRNLLPGDRILRQAEERILVWWNEAYRAGPNQVLGDRFAVEAATSLPGVSPGSDRLDDYYAGLALQRLRLKHNQQAPEWTGERYLRK